MTTMPLPGVTRPVRHEICSSLILHPLGESQKDPYVIVSGLGVVGGAGWQINKPIDRSMTIQ